MNELMAVISGEGVVKSVLILIVLGIIFWLLWWLVDYVGLPQPFNKVVKVILAVAAVIVIINVLLGLIGHPLIAW